MVVSALAFGPMEAVLVAMFGELLNQIISPYGITATTLLWVIPPMIQAAIIGVVALRAQAAGKRMENRPVMCYTVSILAAIVTTAANTAVIWLDSVIYGYYTFALVFGSAMIRFVTGVVAAVLVATVAMPLTILLPMIGGLGTDGVFWAEPVSNVIGGTACFVAMLVTVWPTLKEKGADSSGAPSAKTR